MPYVIAKVGRSRGSGLNEYYVVNELINNSKLLNHR